MAKLYKKFGKIRQKNRSKKIFTLKDSAYKFANLPIDELLKFHFVFDEIEISAHYNDIFEAIDNEILKDFETFRDKFAFDSPYENEIKKALMKFAKSDRKKLGISKILPRFKAQKVVDELLKIQFLKLEKSRETKPKPNHKNEKLPKNLRRYVVHDKVHFKSNFARFYFRFIEPNLHRLEFGENEKVLEMIKADFDNYASLCFEILSKELLAKYLNIGVGEISSFWNNEIEIDIFAKFEDFCVVGECKYKERKICKSVLNLLHSKCEKAKIKPNIIALFSKSGFSEELLSLKNGKILLFDTNDFEILIN